MRDVPKILKEMAATYEERNKVYGNNFLMMGPVMKAMFPNGPKLETEKDYIIFHLFDWAVGKLTRFVNSDMKHIDTIHDVAVYCAMIEAIISEDKPK